MRKLLPVLLSIISFGISSVYAQCTAPGNATITGPATGCTNRVATYKVTATGATSYEWKITGTSTQTAQSNTEYSIVFENSDVTIEVTPMNGTCAGAKSTITVAVSQTPSKPSISQSGNVLDANTTAFAYQWYLGNSPVNGATSKTFSPASNGSYFVEAKNDKGCSTFSNGFNFFKTAIKEDAIFSNFTFYPNPVTTQLFVDFDKVYDLDFSDLSGREVLTEDALRGKHAIDVSSLKRGLYLMKITSDGKTAVRKLLLK